VEKSPVVRLVTTTSSMLENETPWSTATMSPAFFTGVNTPRVSRATSVAATGFVSASGPTA